LTGLLILAILSWLTDFFANMTRTPIDKRSRLVSAAMDLAYQNGFGATSLADIAREA
jgi:AcrR family transcriptional regulator